MLLITVLSQPTRVQAVPPAEVYVCTDIDPFWCDNRPGSQRRGPYPFENDYVATVLKNEWGSNSNHIQALYAGAVAIRTFAQRNADGCGAIAYTYNNIPVWDLVQENVAWFNQRQADIQEITVSVSGTPCP